MSRRLITVFTGGILIATAVMGGASRARAQLSPGDLHEAHANLEGVENCESCHGPRGAGVAVKCLECHTLLRDQLQTGSGLHGRQKYTDCEICHVEHQGRDYDLIWWSEGEANFDHALTGYALRGRHAQAECRACHRASHLAIPELLKSHEKDPNRTFFGLDTTCAGCHADEHRGQLASNCAGCHTNSGWKPAPGFDHGETAFALLGKHRRTTCEKCHATVVDRRTDRDTSYTAYAGLKKKACADCHQDIHTGKLGSQCADCHTPESWKLPEQVKFDHNRTNYPLRGRHAAADCETCHRPDVPHTGLKFERCRDCHRDIHEGEFASRSTAGDCEECHTVRGFLPAIFTLAQHDTTDYPLRGAHGAVACIACHPRTGSGASAFTTAFTFPSTRCTVCHTDPHKGTLNEQVQASGCELCHGVDSWRQVAFDHDSTHYPLAGRHAYIACRQCHATPAEYQTAADLRFTDFGKRCRDCHLDVHEDQFLVAAASLASEPPVDSSGCGRCHTPKSWPALTFDHNTDSRYSLDGAHHQVPCAGCHKPVVHGTATFVRYKPLDTTCKSCHGDKYSGKTEDG